MYREALIFADRFPAVLLTATGAQATARRIRVFADDTILLMVVNL
jgi:hypothetical protein